MEDVLAVYTRPRDGGRPLVCLDETSKQLIAETRVPIPMKAGRPARFDYEYERNGTANLFMMFAPLEGWRHVKVTDRHTAVDYAHVLKELADIHFANAKTIVLVQDNLNIHSKASLYEAFPAAEARRLVERFEWHYTPKHGSWLNLAESELGVLSSQCLPFASDRISLLIDEQATKSAILSAYMRLTDLVRHDDRVLFFFAGHGHTIARRREVGFLIPVEGKTAHRASNAI
jgi:DDE superfamily endonuclease